MRVKFPYRVAAASAALLTALAVAAVGAAARTNEHPGHGHRDCQELGLAALVVEPVAAGSYSDPNGSLAVTISNLRVENGQLLFDWSSNGPVARLIVDAGDLALTYQYNGATSDTGVKSPDDFADRLVFCYHTHTSAVTVASFAATRTVKGVTLAWRTASEVRALGYVVYRESAGKRVRLNRALIRASGAGVYRWLDRSPVRAGRYWLRAVSLDGAKWFGPVRA